MKANILMFLGVLAGSASETAVAQDAGAQRDRRRVDVHVHLRARPPRDAKALDRSVERLIREMDRLGIEKAVLLTPPGPAQGLRQIPSYRAFLDVVGRYRGRLHFLGGGALLNPMIQRYARKRMTDEVRKEFERRAEEIVRAGARGFGELTALHLSRHEGHPFEEVSPDHPLFLLLADIAARHDVPIDLHMDAVISDSEVPPAFRRRSSLNPAHVKANVGALEKLLAHDRKARIVWQHASSDPLGGMTVELLRKLLSAHANLYVAFRVPRADFRRRLGSGARNALLDAKGEFRTDWLGLIREFPDRFLVGSDVFISSEGFWGGTRSLQDAWSAIDKLPEDLARKVGGENARRVYRLD